MPRRKIWANCERTGAASFGGRTSLVLAELESARRSGVPIRPDSYCRLRDAVCHCASPQIAQPPPTKKPLPFALVSFINCHLSQATATTPNGPPLSWLYVPP